MARQPLTCLGLVSFQPSRLRPLKSWMGFPNSTWLKSGLGGSGGMRLPVNSTRSKTPPVICRCITSLRTSPATVAEKRTASRAPVGGPPTNSGLPTRIFRVNASVPSFNTISKSCRPPPTALYSLFNFPSDSKSVSQPVVPSGCFRAQLPRNGFAAAADFFRPNGFSYQTTLLLVWPAMRTSRSPSASMSMARVS